MLKAETPAPKTDSSQPVPPGPMARLWKRYLKARGARVGLVLVVVFALTAFLAPFIAHRLPFVWRDAATGEYAFPLIREFFAPSDTTEPLLEKGINFLFVFIPVALLAWRGMNRRFPALARRDSRAIALLFGAMFAALLWLSIGGMVIQGGGRDWFFAESPPVPEVDDLRPLTTEALAMPAQPGGATAREALLRALSERGLAWLPEQAPDPANPVAMEEARRLYTLRVQDAIDGPALAPVTALAEAGVAARDITDGTLAQGINTPRWNRMIIEAAYPGLLVPMRQFRSAFVVLAAASLLTLLGLTYICLAGAAQFTLSPRWLALLGLAAIVSIPFQLSVRHDQTPYRRLAAEGKGWGLFPILPYGPNEQGFGPRLPPSWWDVPHRIAPEDVRSWDRLIAGLSSPDSAFARSLARLLDEKLPDWRSAAPTREGRDALLAALNDIIETGKAYDEAVVDGSAYDIALTPYLAVPRAGRELPAPHRQRLNRLFAERAAPGALVPAAVIRWKKPNHSAGTHLLGTDESGRDVLVRIIHGARVSLSVGFVSVFLATVIGLVMGSLAAYYGGWIDMIISRFVEIMMCFPSFFLILAVIAVLDRRSIVNIMLVIGLTSWTGMARLVRGEMLRQKKMEYVSASIALGASDTRTIFRHILPNAMAPVLVSISFGITGAILTEAGLSFIGFGVTPPTPTWGQLLSETRDSPLANWWLAVFPGIVLFISVVAYNLVGEALRDALDPRTSL